MLMRSILGIVVIDVLGKECKFLKGLDRLSASAITDFSLSSLGTLMTIRDLSRCHKVSKKLLLITAYKLLGGKVVAMLSVIGALVVVGYSTPHPPQHPKHPPTCS